MEQNASFPGGTAISCAGFPREMPVAFFPSHLGTELPVKIVVVCKK